MCGLFPVRDEHFHDSYYTVAKKCIIISVNEICQLTLVKRSGVSDDDCFFETNLSNLHSKQNKT